MNQLVAFFAPTALPNVAGAAVRAQNGAQGGDFANILAQFQNAIAGDPVQPIDPVTQQILDQLPPDLLQAAANLSTDQIAAQLQALTGAPAGQNPQQLLDPATTQPNTAPDASLAAMLAALQLQTQSATQQPTQTTTAAEPTAAAPSASPTTHGMPAATPTAPAVTPSEIGLRGSVAATEQMPPSQTAQPETAANAKAAENAAAALLAPAAHARPKNESQPHQPQQPQPAKTLADGATGNTQVAPTTAATAQTPNAPTDKPSETPTPANGGAQNNTTPLSPTSTATTGQPAADAAAQPATSAQAATPGISATPSPVLPTLIGAQEMSVTVSAAPQTAVPLGALAIQIARKFDAGISQFEISLHPAELGRLDISLSVADDGHVQAILRAERPETLELLQRDARSLEQQLRQAGLEVGSNALSFSLSGNGQQRHAPFAGWPAFAEAQDAADVAKQDAAKAYIAVRNPDGVDIRV